MWSSRLVLKEGGITGASWVCHHTILIGSSNFLWFARAELGEVKTDAHQQMSNLTNCVSLLCVCVSGSRRRPAHLALIRISHRYCDQAQSKCNIFGKLELIIKTDLSPMPQQIRS